MVVIILVAEMGCDAGMISPEECAEIFDILGGPESSGEMDGGFNLEECLPMVGYDDSQFCGWLGIVAE